MQVSGRRTTSSIAALRSAHARRVLPRGVTFSQVSAGIVRTAVLRSDCRAAACEGIGSGPCNLPALPDGVTYSRLQLEAAAQSYSGATVTQYPVEEITAVSATFRVCQTE